MGNNPITTEFIDSLLTHTGSLFNHVFWVKHHFNLQPSRDHIGSAISFTDISSRKDDFLREIINTITGWVYSKESTQRIINSRLTEVSQDVANAWTFLATQAFSKFRRGHPQGQFGELLLFNFIQHFFKAAPLLRKMRVTTSVGHERFGADAMHIKVESAKNVLVLGESKCYESKYQFKKAFSSSLDSIVNTFLNFNKELNLYTYEDFIEPELETLAIQYKSGKLENTHFELVCLIAYNETNNISGTNESEIKDSIMSTIKDRCDSLDKSIFDISEKRVVDRLNYIIMPIWKLDEFLNEFSNLIGA